MVQNGDFKSNYHYRTSSRMWLLSFSCI